MTSASLDPSAIVQRALEYATTNLRIERLLIQLGLDPSNVTYEAVFARLFDILLVNITFANLLALIGGIFLILSFVVRTIVPMRVLCIVSVVFLIAASLLAGSVQHFLMYFLALPVNVVRLVQIRNLVKRARSSAQGAMSLDWLRPFMEPRKYYKGDVLFRKGAAATEMFLTESGRFLVTEIAIEIPPGRILGELGFLSTNNHRTQSVECIEDGEVLAISYDKLNEIYAQNPEFGYYFLRLTNDRLLQNHARLQKLVEQSNAELAAATAGTNAGTGGTGQASAAVKDEKNSPKATVSAIKNMWAAGLGAIQQQRTSAASRLMASASNVIELFPGAKADPAQSADSAALNDAQRRAQALAIVERYAKYSAAGGFIPLPIVNAAAISAVVLRMTRELSEHYGVPYERDRAYVLGIGLMGGVVPTRLAAIASSTIVHFVPGFNLVGLAVSSVTASAYARGIGHMLIDDFERELALERERLAREQARRWSNNWLLRFARRKRATS